MAADIDLTQGLHAGPPRLLFTGAYTGYESSTLRQLEVVQNWVRALSDVSTSP